MPSIFHKSLRLGCEALWHLKMVSAAFRERPNETVADGAVILPLQVSWTCLRGSRPALLEAEGPTAVG